MKLSNDQPGARAVPDTAHPALDALTNASFNIGQRAVLERIACGSPLSELLERIVQLVEQQADGMTCSLLLLDREHQCVRHGAAPNLPEAIVRAIDGQPIGPQAGSCGTAAYLGQRVIVEDIATDPIWERYRSAFLPHGLRSCWSSPIFSTSGDVLGTFAMYYRQPRVPTEREIRWVDEATHLAAIAILRDQSERALRASEERLRAMVESTPDVAIQWFDAQGRVEFWNPASCTIYGWQADEVMGRTLEALIFTPAEAARFLACIQSVVQTGRPCGPLEFAFHRRDGSPGWCRSTIFRIPFSPSEFRYVCMDVDLTERKRTEQKIRDQATLLDKAKDAILVCTLDGVVDYWNRSAEVLYGWSAQEAVGRRITDLVCKDEPAFAEAQRGLLARGEWAGDLPQLARDGTHLVIEAHWTLVRDNNGHPVLFLAINTDVTERRKLEAQLLRTQRLDSIGTLAGGIAHDFNNILAAIIGNASLASTELPCDHPAQHRLKEIDRASARATDLVRRILTFSRQQEAKRKPITLQPVIEEALKLLRATISPRIEIQTKFSPDAPMVLADATQLHQIIMNLGTNAAHAIGTQSGELTVLLENTLVDAATARSIEGLRPGAYARLTVSDTGSGMDNATLDRIFEPFFTTKAQGQGTGLGLSVVHGIVKNHHGVITVRSAPGLGTAFVIYLPATETCAPTALQLPTRMLRGQGQHILYVDDESAIVSTSSELLVQLGYRVSGFTDAQEALAAFSVQSLSFDVVVTDLSMPGMDGYALAEALLAIRPGLPIIVTSGSLRAEDTQRARALGVVELIEKPSVMDALASTLHGLFSTKP